MIDKTMEKLLALLVVASLLPLAAAENETLLTYNGSMPMYNTTGQGYPGPNITYNDSNLTINGSLMIKPPTLPLPNINFTNLSKSIGNMTKTGVEPVDSFTNFLITASPYLLLIAGVLLFLFAGFMKIFAVILIVLALIRILWEFMPK